jgi:hypothetical protein
MRKMISLMFSVVALVLCGFQTAALAGPIIVMPRVYIPPVRVATPAPAVKVTPPPARVATPKTNQSESTTNSLVPIMTGIAVMNATSSANAASNQDEDDNNNTAEDSDE